MNRARYCNRPTRRGFVRVFTIMLAVGGAAMLGGGIYLVVQERKDMARYTELAEASKAEMSDAKQSKAQPTSDSPSTRDWDSLKDENPSVCAWCSVENTPIDLPIIQASDAYPTEYWLEHDFWREESSLGSVVLDERCTNGSPHCLVCAHHISSQPDAMFSPLSSCYEEEPFASIGRLVWETEALGQVVLAPLCAAKISEEDTLVQTFDFSQTSMTDWLLAVGARASVRRTGWDQTASKATRAVTLVTCSSMLAGQPWRTAVTFCG